MKSGAERFKAARSLTLIRAFKADAHHQSDPKKRSEVRLDFSARGPIGPDDRLASHP